MNTDAIAPPQGPVIRSGPGNKQKLLITLVLVGVSAFGMFRSKFFAQPAQVAPEVVAAEFEKLGQEYDRLAKAQNEALAAVGDEADAGKFTDNKLSDEEWMKQGPGANSSIPDPDAEVLPQYLEFANKYPYAPLAFDALFFVIHRGGPQTGAVHGKPWLLKEEALEVVWAEHSRDPRMVHLLEQLGGTLPSQKTEAFLKRAIESGPNPAVCAAATFHLARYYQALARNHKRSAEIAAKPQLKNFERYWKIVVTPHLERFPIDQDKNFDEIDRLLATVITEFAGVPAVDWKFSGPGNRQIESVPYAQPIEYAHLAKSMLFEVNNIKPGKPAPEIVGTDSDGKEFRLSDYRGKVVLLTFSADWCGTCVEMYPIHRNLVDKYRDRPFVHLSVSRDEAIDTLKSSTASGQVTWRSWWDGRFGPINEAWNSGGIPDLYLLDDQHIIQDAALNRFTTQEEFERAIEPLLEKAAMRSSASQ